MKARVKQFALLAFALVVVLTVGWNIAFRNWPALFGFFGAAAPGIVIYLVVAYQSKSWLWPWRNP